MARPLLQYGREASGHCLQPPRTGLMPAERGSRGRNRFVMKNRRRRKTPMPVMIADLMAASWETIARRTLLIAQNRCWPAEYRRMLHEKAEAAATSGLRLMAGGRSASIASALAPWRSRAVANARRLRKK